MRARTRMTARRLALALVLPVLAACAGVDQRNAPTSEEYLNFGDRHYDETVARVFVTKAKESIDSRNLRAAETAFEQAISAWPSSKSAWEGLAELYHRQEREEDYRIARFFAARMEWIAQVPPLIASAAFENVAEGRVEVAKDNPELRIRSRQLIAFLQNRDAQIRDRPGEQEGFPWKVIPAAVLSLVTGVSLISAMLGS